MTVPYLLRQPVVKVSRTDEEISITRQVWPPRIEPAELLAPEFDAEVSAVLCRAHLAGRLGEARACEAIIGLCDWPLRRRARRPGAS